MCGSPLLRKERGRGEDVMSRAISKPVTSILSPREGSGYKDDAVFKNKTITCSVPCALFIRRLLLNEAQCLLVCASRSSGRLTSKD